MFDFLDSFHIFIKDFILIESFKLRFYSPIMIQSSKSYYKAMNISSGLLLYYTGWVYGSPNVFQGFSTDESL